MKNSFLKDKKIKISNTFKQHRLLLLAFLFFFLLSSWIKVFANAWPYGPGLILDPGCSPTDPDCTVSILPDQTGHSGQFLTTNNGTASWGDVDLSNINVTYTPSGATSAAVGGLASGTDLGTSAMSLQTLLDRILYAATNPSASLSVSSSSREFGSSNAVTLSWTATKNTGTPTITAIAISANNSGTTGSSITPTGNTQSGSNSGTVTQNTTSPTTFTLTVTAGSRSATSTATVQYKHRMYYGVSSRDNVSGSTPMSDAQIMALANSPLSTARTLSSTTFSPSSQYVYFAWPAYNAGWTGFEPSGGCTAIDITNGNPVGSTNCFFSQGAAVTDFLVETRTFTNASGYSTSYKVYRSQNLLSGSVSYAIQ